MPSTGASANRPRDAATRARPATSGGRTPYFMTSLSESHTEVTAITAHDGR